MTLVSQAFHQDQNRLHRSSNRPENVNFPIRVPFLASFVSLLPGPPWLADWPPPPLPWVRHSLAGRTSPVLRPEAAGRRSCGRFSTGSLTRWSHRGLCPVPRIFFFFFFCFLLG